MAWVSPSRWRFGHPPQQIGKKEQRLQSLKDLIERNLSIRHVYGEPVVRGDTTVIPVASVAVAFGGGEGRKDQQEGGGGGGALRMSPGRPPRQSRLQIFRICSPGRCTTVSMAEVEQIHS